MTRDQAVLKIGSIPVYDDKSAYLADVLEALGLLNFYENENELEERVITAITYKQGGASISRYQAATVIDLLDEAGLKIVEK